MKNRRPFASLAGPLVGLAFLLLSAPLPGAGDPVPAAPPAAAAPATADGDFSGKVIETATTAGYTYVQVDTGAKKLWAAATKFDVKVGDEVKVVGGMPMGNFHSKSLDRDFEMIYFTGTIVNVTAGGAAAAALPPGHPALPGQAPAANLPPNHPSIAGQPGAPTLSLEGIARVEGGQTVQEIILGSAELAGKPVKVRGRVVKYNGAVLGKNWLHIRDGSGSATGKTHDLTVTTDTPVKLGDLVVVSGVVTTNKDFGSGYKYSVIIENAAVKVE